MAGKKRKKPAANPARGFATVSVPSKPKETSTPPDDLAGGECQSKDVFQRSQAGSTVAPRHESKQDVSIEDMSPVELEAHLEEAELQLLVGQNAARVKNDAIRQVSRLRNERRQLRVQADAANTRELTDELVEEILSVEPSFDSTSKNQSWINTRRSDVDEADILLKLWTLHEVLAELRLPSIDDALAYVLSVWFRTQPSETVEHIAGLIEAFEWYAGNKEHDDLPNYDTGEIAAAAAQEEPGEEKNGRGAPATITESVSDKHDETTEMGIVHCIPQELDFSDSDEDDDPDALVERWMRLQTLNFNLEEYKNASGYGPRKRKNDQKLQAVERDMLFDVHLAQRKWQPIRRDLEIERAQANKHIKTREKAEVVQANNEIGSDHEEDAILGGMFDNDESALAETVAGSGKNVITKDFGTWTGVHPRRLLEEICCEDLDRQDLRYSSLQTTSFSARLKLVIFWKSKTSVDELVISCLPPGVHLDRKFRTWSFEMRSIATTNSTQAEAFLATLALFVLDASRISSTKHLLRLPKVWRELCLDLKKSLEDARNREDITKLKKLRVLLQAKTATSVLSSTQKAQDGKAPVLDSELPARKKAITKLPAAEAREMWLRRANSGAFERMQVTRRDLPVFAYKQKILHSFEENQILLVCADTGAGKSTQLPSYVLEKELSQGRDFQILVTQPRRISAISIARRVSAELGEGKDDLGTSRSLIGYAIRLESKTSSSTRITFATTGVLLRMLQDSPNLDQLDCLILDEVHERTMDLDLLFIALKQLRTRRPNLKIILMSATVDANKFSAYFDNCPVLDIPGRTFPVDVGFLEDAIEETLDIQSAVGGLQDEEDRAGASDSDELEVKSQNQSSLEKYSVATRKILSHYDYTHIDYQLIEKLATAIATKPKYRQYSKAILIFMPGLAEIRRLQSMIVSSRTFSSDWVVHMLHSSFTTQELEQAFLPPPSGYRKIVIATNIAETGITIPDVTAVIDTCKEKVMRFDERRQLSRLTEGLISRSSARQRKGRAARVREGLCFHFVTRHDHDTRMLEQSTPEMLRLSLQDPVLRIKIWNLGSIEKVLSAAIDPPTAKNIRRAISKLRDVGAIDSAERLTPLGRLMAKLPLDVALSKMAIYGVLFQSLDAILTIIATLSVKSIFIETAGTKSPPQTFFSRGDSDLVTAYNAYSGWKKACKAGTGQQYCHKHHLSQFQLFQVEEQKVQLLVYLNDAGLIVLGRNEQAALNRARSSRKRVSEFDIPARYDRFNNDAVTAAIIAVAFYPKLLRRESGQGYRNVYTNQQLELAPTSSNKIATSKPPKWLCYLEAMQAKSGRLNAFNSSRVTEATILLLLGDAEFKFFAGVVVVDNGNIRLMIRHWKEMLALQRLRQQVRGVVFRFLVNPEMSLQPSDVRWLDLVVTTFDGQPQSRGGIS